MRVPFLAGVARGPQPALGGSLLRHPPWSYIRITGTSPGHRLGRHRLRGQDRRPHRRTYLKQGDDQARGTTPVLGQIRASPHSSHFGRRAKQTFRP